VDTLHWKILGGNAQTGSAWKKKKRHMFIRILSFSSPAGGGSFKTGGGGSNGKGLRDVEEGGSSLSNLSC